MQKIITKTLLTIIFITFFVPKSFAINDTPSMNIINIPESGFFDISQNYWAGEEITQLAQKQIIKGYPNNKFYPEKKITRAEFSALATHALGLTGFTVIEPVKFDDFYRDHWAFDSVQTAIYYDLVTIPKPTKDGYYYFNPNDCITRAQAITIAVNAIGTVSISYNKAKGVLETKYNDFYKTPKWFIVPAGKAEILNMLVVSPDKELALDAGKLITRAEAAVLIYNMIEESKINPNKKLTQSMKNQKSEGHIIQEAIVEDAIGIIPKGTLIPVLVTGKLTSQTAVKDLQYTAIVPKNYISAEKYLLIKEGTRLKGHVDNVKKGKFLFRNGVLTLENDEITTAKKQTVTLKATADITIKKTKNQERFRKIFKGEKLSVDRAGIIYMKLVQDLKIDTTNGWILENQY